MLFLNGKSEVKLIQQMSDVAVVSDNELYQRKATAFDNGEPFEKTSHRGNYELEYKGFINADYRTDYTLRLMHFGTIIYEYTGLAGFGEITELHVESDSDRNAINTLIKYLGLPVICIYRKNYQWYVDVDNCLPIQGDLKLVKENDDYNVYEFKF